MSRPLNLSSLGQSVTSLCVLLGATTFACSGEVNGVAVDGGALSECLANLGNPDRACTAAGINVPELPDDDDDEPPRQDAGDDTATTGETGEAPSCKLSGNLLQNPSFAAGLSGWQLLDADSVIAQTHVDDSADEPSDSGSVLVSLRLSSTDPAHAALRVVSGTTQCFRASAREAYEVAAAVQLASAVPASTEAGFSVFFYAAEDCEGELLETWNSGSTEPSSEWSPVVSYFAAPNNTRSARLRLNTSRLAADLGGEVLYDGVSVKATLCGEAPLEPEPMPEPEAEPEPESDSPLEPETPVDGGVEPEATPEPTPPPEPAVVPEPMPEPEPPAGPSYAATIEPIFVARCLESCHSPGGLGGPGANGGEGPYPGISLNLVEGSGYAQLVDGVLSAQATSFLLVGPTPEESYLWHKLQNTHLSVGGTGLVMPFGAASLSADELQSVRQWIEGGALP
jgi:hypothetical protein